MCVCYQVTCGNIANAYLHGSFCVMINQFCVTINHMYITVEWPAGARATETKHSAAPAKFAGLYSAERTA